jgi:hypothetical protein
MKTEQLLTDTLEILDALTSKTAKNYYAGALTIVLAILTAELILGMF